jgi:hypothetical protein
MEFLNPWFMAAGGALVGAPILIHLINRMRFKRIRWAAMEFLLKSQKRNRRKLIIEQLILLALRCLMVMLAGLLLGRLRLGGEGGEGAFHFIVLDDSISMADHWDQGAKGRNSFDVAKEQMALLVQTVSQARARQDLRVALLSDLDSPIFEEMAGTDSSANLQKKLDEVHPKPLHLPPVAAVEKAKETFAKLPRGKKVFHFVSDFRDRDWHSGSSGDMEALNNAVHVLTDSGAHVSYLDVAHQFRGQSEEVVAPHSNLALVGLKADTSIAPADLPVTFTARIHNYSAEVKKTLMKVYTRPIYLRDPKPELGEKGKVEAGDPFKEEIGAFVAVENIERQQDTVRQFTLTFPKRRKAPELEVKENDKPEERARKRRADAEFVQVRVEINDDPQTVGLDADNVRDVVVELRSQVPTLVVDGVPSESHKQYGDVYSLEVALRSFGTYEIDYCGVEALEKINLDQYPIVLLVNVAAVKGAALNNLRDYVARGGSAAFFMGDNVNVKEYNETLFQQTKNDKGQHLFPILIDDKRPMPPLPKTEEEEAKRVREIQEDPQEKILCPNESHAIVKPLMEARAALQHLRIDRYFRASPRSTWDPNNAQEVQQLIVLPNRAAFDDLKGGAMEMVKEAVSLTADVANEEEGKPEKDQKYSKFKPVLENYRRDVLVAISPHAEGGGDAYYRLVKALESLLNDPGVKNDPAHPNMPDLWAHPKMRDLGVRIGQLKDRLKFGDPLMVTRPYGNGRVLAFLTTAGSASRPDAKAWHEWMSGLAKFTYPILMKEMARYLISQADVRNRTLKPGDDLTLDPLDAARYEGKVRIAYQAQPDAEARDKDGGKPPLQTETRDPLPQDSAGQNYTVAQANPKLGVYTFELFPKDVGGRSDPELQAFAFNLDAESEGDLSRAAKEALVPPKQGGNLFSGAGKIGLRSPGDANWDEFKDPPPELSNMLLLFLFIFAVIAAEMAMAVHLSFHLKQSEMIGTPARGQAAAA